MRNFIVKSFYGELKAINEKNTTHSLSYSGCRTIGVAFDQSARDNPTLRAIHRSKDGASFDDHMNPREAKSFLPSRNPHAPEPPDEPTASTNFAFNRDFKHALAAALADEAAAGRGGGSSSSAAPSATPARATPCIAAIRPGALMTVMLWRTLQIREDLASVK